MTQSTAQRIHQRINRLIVRSFVFVVVLVVFYQLWAVMGWYACIASTSLAEHTRVTQQCMDSWMQPIDGTAQLLVGGILD